MSEYAVARCMSWLLKHFYLKGGTFLRPDGTLSDTRETERSPECFVLNLEAKAWKRRGKTFIQRTRIEWARYYAQKWEMENAEAVYWHDYEEAERCGDFNDLDDWDVDEPEDIDEEPDFDERLDYDDEPQDDELDIDEEIYFATLDDLERECFDEIVGAMEQAMGPFDPETLEELEDEAIV